MQPNINMPSMPYIRQPIQRVGMQGIIQTNIEKLMEQRMREAQYNAQQQAQQQAVASRTPTVLTDPLLNLRVREYYKQKYAEQRNLGTEVLGRAVGSAEGAALGAGIAATVAGIALMIGTIVADFATYGASTADDPYTIGMALSAIGKGAASIKAGINTAAAIGAGVGGTFGAAYADYSTWYATKDMFTNLWKNQSPGRGFLNTMNFVGQSMDLLEGAAIVKSTLYGLINGENVGNLIAESYGMTGTGRKDMDFSLIRESLGFDLGGVGNFIFDMTGEFVSDPGSWSGVIIPLTTAKSSTKAVTKSVNETIETLSKNVGEITEDAAKAQTKSALNSLKKITSEKGYAKELTRYIKDQDFGQFTDLLRKCRQTGDAIIDEKTASKLFNSITNSSMNSLAFRFRTIAKAHDYIDDTLTGTLWKAGNPYIAAIAGTKKVHEWQLIPKFIAKAFGPEASEAYKNFIFGNNRLVKIWSDGFSKYVFGDKFYKHTVFNNLTAEFRLTKTEIELVNRFKINNLDSLEEILNSNTTSDADKILLKEFKERLVKHLETRYNDYDSQVEKLTNEYIERLKKAKTPDQQLQMLNELETKISELHNTQDYISVKYGFLELTDPDFKKIKDNINYMNRISNHYYKGSANIPEKYSKEFNKRFKELWDLYLQDNKTVVEFMESLGGNIKDFITKNLDAEIQKQISGVISERVIKFQKTINDTELNKKFDARIIEEFFKESSEKQLEDYYNYIERKYINNKETLNKIKNKEDNTLVAKSIQDFLREDALEQSKGVNTVIDEVAGDIEKERIHTQRLIDSFSNDNFIKEYQDKIKNNLLDFEDTVSPENYRFARIDYSSAYQQKIILDARDSLAQFVVDGKIKVLDESEIKAEAEAKGMEAPEVDLMVQKAKEINELVSAIVFVNEWSAAFGRATTRIENMFEAFDVTNAFDPNKQKELNKALDNIVKTIKSKLENPYIPEVIRAQLEDVLIELEEDIIPFLKDPESVIQSVFPETIIRSGHGAQLAKYLEDITDQEKNYYLTKMLMLQRDFELKRVDSKIAYWKKQKAKYESEFEVIKSKKRKALDNPQLVLNKEEVDDIIANREYDEYISKRYNDALIWLDNLKKERASIKNKYRDVEVRARNKKQIAAQKSDIEEAIKRRIQLIQQAKNEYQKQMQGIQREIHQLLFNDIDEAFEKFESKSIDEIKKTAYARISKSKAGSTPGSKAYQKLERQEKQLDEFFEKYDDKVSLLQNINNYYIETGKVTIGMTPLDNVDTLLNNKDLTNRLLNCIALQRFDDPEVRKILVEENAKQGKVFNKDQYIASTYSEVKRAFNLAKNYDPRLKIFLDAANEIITGKWHTTTMLDLINLYKQFINKYNYIINKFPYLDDYIKINKINVTKNGADLIKINTGNKKIDNIFNLIIQNGSDYNIQARTLMKDVQLKNTISKIIDSLSAQDIIEFEQNNPILANKIFDAAMREEMLQAQTKSNLADKSSFSISKELEEQMKESAKLNLANKIEDAFGRNLYKPQTSIVVHSFKDKNGNNPISNETMFNLLYGRKRDGSYKYNIWYADSETTAATPIAYQFAFRNKRTGKTMVFGVRSKYFIDNNVEFDKALESKHISLQQVIDNEKRYDGKEGFYFYDTPQQMMEAIEKTFNNKTDVFIAHNAKFDFGIASYNKTLDPQYAPDGRNVSASIADTPYAFNFEILDSQALLEARIPYMLTVNAKRVHTKDSVFGATPFKFDATYTRKQIKDLESTLQKYKKELDNYTRAKDKSNLRSVAQINSDIKETKKQIKKLKQSGSIPNANKVIYKKGQIKNVELNNFLSNNPQFANKIFTNTELGKASTKIDVVYVLTDTDGSTKYVVQTNIPRIIEGTESKSFGSQYNEYLNYTETKTFTYYSEEEFNLAKQSGLIKSKTITQSFNAKTGVVTEPEYESIDLDGNTTHTAIADTELMSMWLDDYLDNVGLDDVLNTRKLNNFIDISSLQNDYYNKSEAFRNFKKHLFSIGKQIKSSGESSVYIERFIKDFISDISSSKSNYDYMDFSDFIDTLKDYIKETDKYGNKILNTNIDKNSKLYTPIKELIDEFESMDYSLSAQLDHIYNIMFGDNVVGHYQINKFKTTAMLTTFSKYNIDYQNLISFFNGNTKGIINNDTLAQMCDDIFHNKKYVMSKELETRLDIVKKAINDFNYSCEWINMFLEKLNPESYYKFFDFLNQFEHHYDLYKRGRYLNTTEMFNGIKKARRSVFEDLTPEEELLFNQLLTDEGLRKINLPNSRTINDLIYTIKDNFQYILHDAINSKSIAKEASVATNEFGEKVLAEEATNTKTKEANILDYSDDFDNVLTEAFATLRESLRETKRQNNLLKRSPVTIQRLNRESELFVDDPYLTGSVIKDYLEKNKETMLNDGFHRLRPNEAIKFNSSQVFSFNAKTKRNLNAKRLINEMEADNFVERTGNELANIPIITTYESRLAQNYQLIANMFNADITTIVNDYYNSSNYKNKSITNLYNELFEAIVNGEISLDNYGIDKDLFTQFVAIIKSMNETTFPYIKDVNVLKSHLIGAFVHQIYDFTSDSRPAVNYLEGTDIFKKAERLYQLKDSKMELAFSNEIFDEAKKTFINADGTPDYKGFREFLKRHPEYNFVGMDENGKWYRYDYNDDKTLEYAFNSIHSAIVSKDEYISYVSDKQRQNLPDVLLWVKNHILRTLKVMSLAWNLPFIIQNVSAAELQNVISTEGKINLPRQIKTTIQTWKDYNLWKKFKFNLLQSNIGKKYLIKPKDFDKCFELFSDEKFLTELAQSTNAKDKALAEVLKKADAKKLADLKLLDEILHTSAAFGEINEIMSINVKKDIDEVEFRKAQDIVNNKSNIGTEEYKEAQRIINRRKYNKYSNKELQNELSDIERKLKSNNLNRYERRALYKDKVVVNNILQEREYQFFNNILKYTYADKFLNFNNDLEAILRATAIKSYLEDGLSFDQATWETIKRQFIYSDKSLAEQYSEFIIPFISYPIRAALLWEDLTNDANIMDIMYWATKYSWGKQESKQQEKSDYLSKRRARGDIPVGDQLVNVMGNPFGEAVMSVQDPLYTMNNKLNPVLKPAVDLLTESEHVRWNQLPLVSNVDTVTQMINEHSLVSQFTNDYYRYNQFGNYYLPRYTNRISGNIYNKMYTRSGYSRLQMRMSPLTSSNLKYRINDILKYNGPTSKRSKMLNINHYIRR